MELLDKDYATIAASQTAQVLGSAVTGNILEKLIIIPATTSPGIVSITDGNGSAITVFTGGASSVADLKPMEVKIGARNIAATTPGWKVTTGANVSVIAVGRFL